MEVAGLDACKHGWVGVRLADGVFAGASVHPDVASALIAYAQCKVVTVDMPLGLPNEDKWAREADQAARVFVGQRRNSVFAIPPRRVLDAESHAEAVMLCRARGQKGVSIQAYGLRTRLFEANLAAEADSRVYEVHPEVSFRSMAAGEQHLSLEHRFPQDRDIGASRRDRADTADVLQPRRITDQFTSAHLIARPGQVLGIEIGVGDGVTECWAAAGWS